MTATSIRALIDTSVFIAAESGRRLDIGALPEGSTASVITFAELTAGVLRASDIATRSRRLATVAQLRSMELLPVTELEVLHLFCERSFGHGRSLTIEKRHRNCMAISVIRDGIYLSAEAFPCQSVWRESSQCCDAAGIFSAGRP